MQMFIRTDLLEEAGLEIPTTWSELLATAKALTTDDMYGCCLPAGQNNCTTLWMNMFINMAGGNVCGEDLQPTLDTEYVVKALEFYKELAQYCPPGITSYGYSDQITAFCSGKAAISFYQGRIIARVYNEAPDLLDKYAVCEVPTCDDGRSCSLPATTTMHWAKTRRIPNWPWRSLSLCARAKTRHSLRFLRRVTLRRRFTA